MENREMVIKGLEHCIIICESINHNPCKGCEYQGTYDCADKLKSDALVLLKEQEAVKPSWNRGKPFCGVCGLRIHGGKFCSECGRPIAWEDR